MRYVEPNETGRVRPAVAPQGLRTVSAVDGADVVVMAVPNSESWTVCEEVSRIRTTGRWSSSSTRRRTPTSCRSGEASPASSPTPAGRRCSRTRPAPRCRRTASADRDWPSSTSSARSTGVRRTTLAGEPSPATPAGRLDGELPSDGNGIRYSVPVVPFRVVGVGPVDRAVVRIRITVDRRSTRSRSRCSRERKISSRVLPQSERGRRTAIEAREPKTGSGVTSRPTRPFAVR